MVRLIKLLLRIEVVLSYYWFSHDHFCYYQQMFIYFFTIINLKSEPQLPDHHRWQMFYFCCLQTFVNVFFTLRSSDFLLEEVFMDTEDHFKKIMTRDHWYNMFSLFWVFCDVFILKVSHDNTSFLFFYMGLLLWFIKCFEFCNTYIMLSKYYILPLNFSV